MGRGTAHAHRDAEACSGAPLSMLCNALFVKARRSFPAAGSLPPTSRADLGHREPLGGAGRSGASP